MSLLCARRTGRRATRTSTGWILRREQLRRTRAQRLVVALRILVRARELERDVGARRVELLRGLELLERIVDACRASTAPSRAGDARLDVVGLASRRRGAATSRPSPDRRRRDTRRRAPSRAARSSCARSASDCSSCIGARAVVGGLRGILVVGGLLRELAELASPRPSSARGRCRRRASRRRSYASIAPSSLPCASSTLAAHEHRAAPAASGGSGGVRAAELRRDRCSRRRACPARSSDLGGDELRVDVVRRPGSSAFCDRDPAATASLLSRSSTAASPTSAATSSFGELERLAIALARDVEPAADARDVGRERPRLRRPRADRPVPMSLRARIASSIGFALRRLRGRQRRGEPDLRADVILRELEHRREVGLRAGEIGELRASPCRARRARAASTFGSAASAASNDFTALAGSPFARLRPAEVERQNPFLGSRCVIGWSFWIARSAWFDAIIRERLRAVELRSGARRLRARRRASCGPRRSACRRRCRCRARRRATPRLRGRSRRCSSDRAAALRRLRSTRAVQ